MKIHVVKQGDTLYDLAKKYGVDLQKLIDMNPHIKDPDVIHIGDKIKIPSKTQMIGSMAQSAKEKMLQTTKIVTDVVDKKKPEEKKVVKQQEAAKQEAVKQEVVKQETLSKAKVKPGLPSQLSVTFKAETAKEKPKSEANIKPQTESETKNPYAAYHIPAKPVSSFYDLPKIPGMDDAGSGSVNQAAPVAAESVGYPQANSVFPQHVMPNPYVMPEQMGPYGNHYAGNMPPHPGMMLHQHQQASYPLPPFPAAQTEVPVWWQNTAPWPPLGMMPYGEVPKQNASLKVNEPPNRENGEDEDTRALNDDDSDASTAVIKSTRKKVKPKKKRNRQKSTRNSGSRSRNPWINV